MLIVNQLWWFTAVRGSGYDKPVAIFVTPSKVTNDVKLASQCKSFFAA